ncbi:cell envelope integrity protein CreD [Sphingobacterium sp. CZ-UAM]|uniref:cell envelope integrity protein CreD n=1 Tax=Sphingobacterium sp. CZ-UAM TaxID=1933868 RepID=UPI000984986C|nr:cell envelope integrity protein CreD [Sphingobacterium sp. CZ-UAM]OOG15985.1 cell envelope integrity protein CreD [Sphingobacterium sp. CZ-UAM]
MENHNLTKSAFATEQHSLFDKISNSTVLKLFVILFLSLLLLIPLAMISDLIQERKTREQSVSDGIALNWGQEQVISGPVIAIPYNEIVQKQAEKSKSPATLEYKQTKWIFILPQSSNISTDISPQHLSRGIYNTVVYNSHILIEGSFNKIDLTKLEIPIEKIDWKGSRLVFGIQDFKGLGKRPSLKWNDLESTFDPDFNNLKLFNQNLVCPIAINPQSESHFKITLDLKGSKSLNFVPLGDQTNIAAKGNWANPSFTGAFLPSKRSVSNSNFSASWEIPSFSRKLPQQWSGDIYPIYIFEKNKSIVTDEVEVPQPTAATAADTKVPSDMLLNSDMITINFLPDVNNYQKTTRVAKYGILIILLTFTSLLFTEIIKKKRIHIIQYVLIGAAMVLFYTLLLALSEHIGFNPAYLIASVATVVLIGSFIKAITKDFKSALLLGSILGTFYVFIYVLMQLRDYSLIAGTIGIFIILAILMRVSTKINWYQFDNNHADQ